MIRCLAVCIAREIWSVLNMKFLFASDSFKGTLSSSDTARLLRQAAEEVFPGCETDAIPVADGGEGTVEAVVNATGGSIRSVTVKDPLFRPVKAVYGSTGSTRAVIEMAQASGLLLLREEEKNPLETSSYGTGELIRDALDNGFRDISIAIGGSATIDGGMGCMTALGAMFLDESGNALSGCGGDLERVSTIDLSGLDPRIAETKITVMCDVDNPLCGERGATYTFGKQKGADEEMQKRLEAGMCRYRDLIRKTCNTDPDAIAGSGAAGGLGCALCVFLHGEMRSGIRTVLELIGFESRLKDVDLVVTGEGRTDWQSCYGKVMQGIGMFCKEKNIPVIGLSGSLGKGAEDIFQYGVESLITSVDAPMPMEEAFARAEELYLSAARRMFRILRAGTCLRSQVHSNREVRQ